MAFVRAGGNVYVAPKRFARPRPIKTEAANKRKISAAFLEKLPLQRTRPTVER